MDKRRLMLVVALFCQTWIAECQGNDILPCNKTKVQNASIGRKLNITCTLFCSTGSYRWFNGTGQLQGETSDVLNVSEKVESAAAVGGQRYVCQCGETVPTQCHLIWVIPFVKFDVSTKIAKLGSSVTFTCSAESFPPADNVFSFQLHHPSNHSIPYDKLTLNGTSVVYRVDSARPPDGGEYDCVVNVNETLQSENRTYITVYDPPVITSNMSSAVVQYSASRGESAVLKCVVKNVEKNLKVWVNWTTGSGSDILMGGNYIVGSNDEGVHILVVLNVTKDNVRLYTCQLYSIYSPNTPEDQQTINITVVDPQKYTETSELNKPENCNCSGTIVATSVLSVIMTIILIIMIVVVVVVVSCRKCKRKTSPHEDSRTEDRTIWNNSTVPSAEHSDDVQAPQSPVSAEGPEQGTSDINPNGSLHQSLSTQNSGSPTSATERGDSVVPNTTSSRPIEIPKTKEESPPLPVSTSPTKRLSLLPGPVTRYSKFNEEDSDAA